MFCCIVEEGHVLWSSYPMKKISIHSIDSFHNYHILWSNNIEDRWLMSPFKITKVGLSTTYNKHFSGYVIPYFKRKLKRCHVLCIKNFQIRTSIDQKVQAFMMLTKNSNWYSCKPLLCLLIQWETVVYEKHLNYVWIVFINCHVKCVHSMLW